MPEKYAALRQAITEVFQANDGRHGYRRVQMMLRRSSCAGEISAAVENGVDRDFNADARLLRWHGRGGHYRWPGWIARTECARLTRSMSEKGCTPDSAACEGFLGRLKSEMFHDRSWHDVSTEKFVDLVDQYIRWYNEKRIKLSLGGVSPVKYRQSLGNAA